ncbi:PilZ domain-containing protein [Methylobacterium sp. sgz302541]|uniref:PilZ domain-containing protein n=1 Tax=unclassified Methylobacterium TaxID=2615210 RepID=UPI003D34E613
MIERRTTPRQRSYLGARLGFNAQWSTMDCLVRNYTEAGAKLVFASAAVPLPDAFDLVIASKGIETRAHVVWRREGEMGVSFARAQARAGIVSLDLARRLRVCESERDALRARLAQLAGSA